MRRLGYVVAAALVAVGIALVLLHWQLTVEHLSQESGTSNEASRSYAFWSGIGGLITIVGGVATGVVTYYRHHNCHDPKCWRIGHFPLEDPATGVTYRQCRIHHPHVPDELAHHGLFRHHFEKSHMDAVRERVLRAHQGDKTPTALHPRMSMTTANPHTVNVTDFTVVTPKEQAMSLLSDIERRFTTDAERVVTDVEKAAKSKIGLTLLNAAKEIVPLLPEGREASLVLTKLEEVEAWAHRALAAATTTADTTSSPTEADAPVASDPTAAAPVDSSTAPEPAAATGGDASIDQAAPATAADAAASVPVAAKAPAEAAPPAAPAAAPAAAPPLMFTTNQAPGDVDVAAWPLLAYTTPAGQQLYGWAGQGPAPADGVTWTVYSGPVISTAA